MDSETSKEAIIIAAQASQQPLCVHGPPGCGKSRLINLAWQSRRPGSSLDDLGPVSVNIDDSVDVKSLIGTFQSSLIEPGRFEWIDGLLVELIKKGRWLVLEDVDRLNPDILSILPRQGDTHFRIPETNSYVEIHRDFGLIGTSTNSRKLARTLSNWLLLECGYPKNLMAILNNQLPPIISEIVLACYTALIESRSNAASERKFGLHDLFRAVSRIERILACRLKISESATFVTDFQKAQIGHHLIDVFVHHSPFPERKAELEHIIESWLGCGSIGSDSCPTFSSDSTCVSIGDIRLARRMAVDHSIASSCSFTLTSVHLRMLQKIARGIQNGEGILVVGDTGVGKTTTVQFLSKELGVEMHVYNFSDQTEGSDLIGGLKPVMELDKLVAECEHLVRTTLPESSHRSGLAVLEYIASKAEKRDFQAVVQSVEKTAFRAITLMETSPAHAEAVKKWRDLASRCISSGKIFKFIEGPLVTAVRTGDWIFLDEINLAPPAVLRLLNGLLENGKIVIPETGEQIKVHSGFRLIAAMNPPHLGKGKRALTDSLRSRLTEIYCEEVTEKSDLMKIIHMSLERDLTVTTLQVVVPKIIDLYLNLKGDIKQQLSSLEGGPPVFSLRSLSRALEFAKRLLRSPKRIAGAQAGDGTRELVDGLKVSLTSAIDARSEEIVTKLIDSTFPLPARQAPSKDADSIEYSADGWVKVQGHWVACGDEPENLDAPKFIVTESVSRNLKKLTICLAGGKIARPPIICEGSTGAGKTSLVTYLSRMSRHKLVRINNHEHTDLQDYFGQYVSQPDGGLLFQEGPLVTAVRNGWWVLLDELNLAPSEVLEALNRLLDDNRQLVVPETNEVIKAHPDFVLFASQNPVTLDYAGRKTLSRAFRNRFIDIQIDELPSNELGVILAAKCTLAESTSTRMLATYSELSRLRRLDQILSGRDSALITVRDLLRWGMRHPTTREEIAIEGYLVLAERLRSQDQKNLVIKVLEDKVGVKNLQKLVNEFYLSESAKIYDKYDVRSFGFVRTKALDRMLALVARSVEAGESILAVGETGTGKTSALQLVSALYEKRLRIINCHQHLESSDLLGAVGPEAGGRLAWKDGPLIESCRAGGWLLLDEVNLADDSVVERLNSLLDVDFRAVTLAEKPREETVVADKAFRLLCTMNPGNDFGKKELSAALRNRFTEIWVDSVDFSVPTAETPINERSTGYSMIHSILKFEDDAIRSRTATLISSCMALVISDLPSLNVSTRDAILWCDFVNSAASAGTFSSVEEAVVHGASLVLLDALESDSHELATLTAWFSNKVHESVKGLVLGNSGSVWIQQAMQSACRDRLQFGPFPLPPSTTYTTGSFSLNAPTSALNFGRLIRGMFAGKRPILLHGDPGAGKSSAVAALAQFYGVELVRINLSDQTELADILGQNVPDVTAEAGKSSAFVWKDGILLDAISRGAWVLLDELNLAPQPVLEGLNALLDHRAEIYIPAIDRLVKCPSSFRLFATQNEAKKGDGRKRLPKSFLSRFNRIRVNAMGLADLALAAKESMRGDDGVVDSAIRIISGLTDAQLRGFDWNLRDISRLLKCVHRLGHETLSNELAWMVFGSRIADPVDRQTAMRIITGGNDMDWIDTSKYLDMGSVRSVSGRVDLIKSQATAVAAFSVTIQSGCHSILTGESGSGKRSVVRLVSEFLNKPVVEMRMQSQMDTSDLIGQFSQQINTKTSSVEFRWMDSPLTTAVRSGGWVVLTNAHCCPPEILDRLNALIEDNGLLVIPEKGEAETVKPHSEFRLILVSEQPNLLSHAIRNRCVEISLATTAISVYDKLRVGFTCIPSSPDMVLKVAQSCTSVRHMHQCSSLVAAGLPVDTAIAFVTGNSADDSDMSPVLLSAVAGESAVDREWAAAKAMMDNSPELQKEAMAWFIESAVTEADLASRLTFCGADISMASLPLVRICWSVPQKRRLIVSLMLRSPQVLSQATSDLAALHTLTRMSSQTELLLQRLTPSGDSTCFESLASSESISISQTDLRFTGAYREQSEQLLAQLVKLSSIKSVPSTVVVELAASAIALRTSRDDSAISNESKILNSVNELLIPRTLLDESSPQVTEVQSTDEDDTVRINIERLLRLCGVANIDTLVKCGVELTEADLVFAGVARASDWTGGSVSSERVLTILMNLIGLDTTKSQAVHAALEGAKTVACGDLEAVVERFGILHKELGTNNSIFSKVDLETDRNTLIGEVVNFDLLDRETDRHVEKQLAVDDLMSESLQLTLEADLKNLCRDASALGIDGTDSAAWKARVDTTCEHIEASGIFYRPTGSGYEKLRYLFGEVRNTLTVKPLNEERALGVIVAFARTVSNAEYCFYRDITRPLCLRLLKLGHVISLRIRERNFCSAQVPVPVSRDALRNAARLVEWINVERQSGVLVKTSGENILRSRINETVVAVSAAKEVPVDEQVIIQGDVEISLSSLVQDNDKATADAAVARFRKELFPDTSSKFIQSLKAAGSDMYIAEMLDVEDTSDDSSVIADSDLDKLAIAIVAAEQSEISMKSFLSVTAAEFMTHHSANDCPELIALNRLRLRQFIDNATVPPTQPEVPELENVEEDAECILRDNREMKLKLADFIRDGGSTNFYSAGGGSEAIALLSRPLVSASKLLSHLLKIRELCDHPDLIHAQSVVRKALTLKADCSAICALQAAEYVLGCVEKLDKSIPSRYLNDSKIASAAVVPSLIAVIARLRASEIASWKELRLIRATLISKSGAGKWFVHLWNSASDEGSFDTVLAWLRNSGIGQFSFRLALVEAVASLTHCSVLSNAVALAKLWELSVNRKVRVARSELDKQVKALTKEIRFRLGGRHYSNEMFRIDTKRSHNQLAAAFKRFEESISQPVQEVIASASSLPMGKLTETDLSSLVRDTMEAIRCAPSDKSSKAMKTRLLADLTGETREFVKSSLSLETVSPKEFDPRFVMGTMVRTDASNSSSSHLLSRCMQITSMQPVCKNQDVRPATVLEWRTLAAYAVEIFAAAAKQAIIHSQNQKIRNWESLADCSVDRDLVVSGLEYLDRLSLLAKQFELLSGHCVESLSLAVPAAISEQVNTRWRQLSSILTTKTFVKTDLVRKIRDGIDCLIPRAMELFTTRRSDLCILAETGNDLCRRLEECVVMDIKNKTEHELTSAVAVDEVSASVMSVLDFAIFVHEEGLCSRDPQDDEQQTKEGSTEWCDGTGLGDGSGVNDKSEEIEDAGQFDTDRNESKGDKPEEEEEQDLDKGIDANQDQGMNEDDVEEKNGPRKETEDDEQEPQDDEDREMGHVDLDEGGEIDDQGAPGSDNEDDEEDENYDKSKEDNVELKNQQPQRGDENVRANEGKNKQDQQQQEGADAESEEMEESGTEEESDDGEKQDEIEGEKHEAFVDQKNQQDEQLDEKLEDELGNDIESFNSESGSDDLAPEDHEGSVVDENVPDDDTENPLDETEVDKRDEDRESNADEEMPEQSVGDKNIDSSAGTGENSEPAQATQQSSSQHQAENKNQPTQNQSSSSADANRSANVEACGTDYSSKQKPNSQPKTRPAPSPLAHNSSEALDEWLKEVKEVVEKASRENNMMDDSETTGDVGEKHDDSDKAAMARASESAAGAVNDQADRDEESVGDAKKTEDATPESDLAEGVHRDKVVAAEDGVPDEADEAESESESVTEESHEEMKKRESASKPMTDDDTIDHIPESHGELPPIKPLVNADLLTKEFQDIDLIDLSEIMEKEMRANKLASELSEKLMAVLEPTKRGRLEGFFKTGKRVSMRRVLSWIASDYRRDKFWLRRTKPSHRDYKVVICLDNTLSMKNNGVGELSLICVSAISQSLQLLDVGKVGVMSFGTEVREICPLDDSASNKAGGGGSLRELMREFRFNEESTNSFSEAFPQVVHRCADAFKASESGSDSSGGSLALIITDGRFDKEKCRPYVHELITQGHVPVLIVMDANKEESILSVTSVTFEEDSTSGSKRRKIVRKPFLSQADCPFPFYAVVQEPTQLPTTLADILRQWIEVTSK